MMTRWVFPWEWQTWVDDGEWWALGKPIQMYIYIYIHTSLHIDILNDSMYHAHARKHDYTHSSIAQCSGLDQFDHRHLALALLVAMGRFHLARWA